MHALLGSEGLDRGVSFESFPEGRDERYLQWHERTVANYFANNDRAIH